MENFKVRCVYAVNGDDKYYTVGKVYDVINGNLLDNDNDINNPFLQLVYNLERIHEVDDSYKFEIVE